MNEMYLKPNILAEPLINGWYAWPYLLSPATGSMFLVHTHMHLMASFVKTPQIHVAALKNPKMRGGPFLNYPVERAGEIQALLERTEAENESLLQLARAIKELDEMLETKADGHSLEPLYPEVPAPLRGYVELIYDRNNHASIRFIEALLYKSPFYNESIQSVALSHIEGDTRFFLNSTPLLADSNRMILKHPFRDGLWDRFFGMKDKPGPVGEIADSLGVEDRDRALFESFFTTTPPRQAPRFAGEGVRVRYFGHACVLIETRDVAILCDPLISYEYPSDLERLTYADLPEKIDYVLITHSHQDHVMFESLLQLRARIGTVVVPKSNGGALVDPSLRLALRAIGFPSVREIDELETIDIPGGSIMGLPFLGEHADLNVRSKMAHRVALLGKTFLMAADSDNIEPLLYEHLRAIVGPIDVLFLGMECDGAPMSWAMGALFTKRISRKMDQSRRFTGSDYEKAMDIVNRLGVGEVYVYAMGGEPWLAHLMAIDYTATSKPIVESDRLVAACAERHIPAERLFGFKEIHLP